MWRIGFSTVRLAPFIPSFLDGWLYREIARCWLRNSKMGLGSRASGCINIRNTGGVIVIRALCDAEERYMRRILSLALRNVVYRGHK